MNLYDTGYNGQAGDALYLPSDPQHTMNNQMFSTPDQDQDGSTGELLLTCVSY